MSLDRWMSCSACRNGIGFSEKHWVCSVSTCNRSRTKLVFCSVSCWDSHLSVLRHREAWAVEAIAPTRAEYEAGEREGAVVTVEEEPRPERIERPVVRPAERPVERPIERPIGAASDAPAGAFPLAEADESEILIVMSKMKKYIRERSGMNISDAVGEALSDHVRAICDAAIRTAMAAGRKTVLDRDVPPVRRG